MSDPNKNTLNYLPFVSVVLACRNESRHISECLDSLNLQDYPKNKLEILIIDGASDDGTKKIIKGYVDKFSFMTVLDNAKKFTPFAFNIGIKNSKGEVIIFFGTHAVYSKDYISKCVRSLNEYGADNVGGIMNTLPKNETIIAKAVASSLSSEFGAGSYFRTGSDKPREVDTVFGGCYRRDVFDRIGLFNENLLRSQDIELNLRLKKAGGKIILAPDIVLSYYPKSNLKDFAVHNFEDGVWAIYPAKFMKMPLKLRHYVPLIFVMLLAITLAIGMLFPKLIIIFMSIASLYLMTNLYFSIKIAIREKTIEYIFILPIVFMIRHFFYGAGSLWGLMKLLR